jgi:hypothetical protein
MTAFELSRTHPWRGNFLPAPLREVILTDLFEIAGGFGDFVVSLGAAGADTGNALIASQP